MIDARAVVWLVEGAEAAPAAQSQHQMIESADRFEKIAHLRRIGGVERPRIDFAG